MKLAITDERKLWHFTCDTDAELLGDVGLAVPAGDHLMPPLVWLTDSPRPRIEGLPHHGHVDTCGPLLHRYSVEPGVFDADPWVEFRRSLADEVVWALELAEGAQPEHWLVSRNPIPVRYAPLIPAGGSDG